MLFFSAGIQQFIKQYFHHSPTFHPGRYIQITDTRTYTIIEPLRSEIKSYFLFLCILIFKQEWHSP